MAKINSTLLEGFMKENKLTKKQLAQKCGVSPYIIRKMLSGECKATASTLIKISLLTKLKVNDLLFLPKR